MAINKKLIHFNTNANFSKENTAGNILDTSIVFVKDAKKIVTHSSEYPAVNWGNIDDKFISSRDAVAGDVCFYDSQRDKLVLVRAAYVNATNYPSSRFTPIGVVVVPGTHNVYGDLSCGVVSLREMSCSTPDVGTTDYENILFGPKININKLPNLEYIPYVGTCESPGDSKGTIIGYTNSIGSVFAPSDEFSTTLCPHDTNSSYLYNDSSYAVPSPYLTDGSRNPGYYKIDDIYKNNCLSDFQGDKNTSILINEVYGQPNWKIDSEIVNSADLGHFPAVCCCWRFHTDGTNQGDWYLPAMGELTYMMVRFKKINSSFANLSTIYSSESIASIKNPADYWSSTEASSDRAVILSTLTAGVYIGDKLWENRITRAFLRVKI